MEQTSLSESHNDIDEALRLEAETFLKEDRSDCDCAEESLMDEKDACQLSWKVFFELRTASTVDARIHTRFSWLADPGILDSVVLIATDCLLLLLKCSYTRSFGREKR